MRRRVKGPAVPVSPLLAGLAMAATVAAAAAPSVGGQTLGERVRSSEGDVAFHFAVREGVELCEGGVVVHGGSGTRWEWRRQGERRCSSGLGEAVLTVREGTVRSLDVEPWEGPGSTPSDARDLGRVAAPEAAGFLVSLARSGREPPEAAEDGLRAAVLADSAEVWPELLEVARDRSLDEDVREAGAFWLGQAAGDAVTAGLADLAGEEDQEQGVRNAALFALSRRPDDEAVPVLMELARAAREPETRRAAMFWLARSDDERVLPFFEEVLLGRSGGA